MYGEVMMEKRKGNLRKKMLAALLSAALVAGMVSNGVTVSVSAKESVREYGAELTEEETDPAERADSGKTEEAEEEAITDTVETAQEQTEAETAEPETEEMLESAGTDTAADEVNKNLLALFERIDALPDVEEYLGLEPDVDSEEADENAYEQWLAGLYAYAEEALAIQEAVTELTEEEQVQIPEEVFDKLAAWIYAAEQANQSSAVMAADGRAASGDGWELSNDGTLTITTNDGSTAWRDSVSDKTQVISVEIQDGVTSIGVCAFQECSSLASITISNSVTSVLSFAFASCSSLTSITIPKDVTSIGNSVFQNCGKLANVTMAGETPPAIGTSVFYGGGFVKNDAKGIHVPTGKADAYKAAWKDWAAYIADDTTADTHEHNGVTFTAWTETDRLPTDAGNYYLTEDVTLNAAGGSWIAAWNPADGTKLCLNGHTVKTVSQRDVIGVNQSITFSMYDCQKTGMITQAGATDESVQYGCGIRNEGTVHMYGGRICGNAQKIGAGVYNDKTGTFYLHDGEISNNKASYSHGGAYNDGVFYMYGGKITGNQAKFGGGLNNYSSNAKMYLYGGEIIGNHATSLYGGLQYSGGTMKIGGALVVKDNTAGSNNSISNLCLWSSYNLIIELDSERPLESGAYVGITTIENPTRFDNRDVTGHNKDDYSGYFHSDNSSYVIVNNNNVVQLALPEYDVTVNGGTVSGGTGSASYKAGATVTITANAPASGKAFDKWVVNSGSVTLANAANATTTFTMPAEAVTVTAVYKDTDTTPPVIKAGDEVIPTEGTTEYEVDSLLKITVTDDNLASVKYNWTDVKVSGGSSMFSLSAGTYTIVATDKTGNKTTVRIIVKNHDYDNSVWGYREADGHAHKCKNCDKHNTVIAHTPGPAATEETPQTCTVCGYEISPALGHTHRLTLTAAKAPTCTGEGNSAYYTCNGCGKYFSDGAGTNEITPDSVKIAALGHDYNTSEWGYKGADGHAHKCKNCDAHDTVTAHTEDSGTVTTPPTETSTGIRTYKCTVCEKMLRTETIPATGGGNGGNGGSSGDSGNDNNNNDDNSGINNDSNNDDSNSVNNVNNSVSDSNNDAIVSAKAPVAVIITPQEELENAALTETEKQQTGMDIRIVLEVEDASADVSAADRLLVETALNSPEASGYTIGQYLDISLYKVIGDSRTVITETNGMIIVTIAVPESLKSADPAATRTFAVLRVHNGVAELLADLDNSSDMITIATDRFSTYAIVFKDTAGIGSDEAAVSDADKNNPNPVSQKDNEPKTGDTAPVELYATLAMIMGLGYLLLYFEKPGTGMTEERKKELVAGLVGWAKQGGKLRRLFALAVIFVLLVYYHGIAKKKCAEWKEAYGE